MYKYYRNKCVVRSPSEQRKIIVLECFQFGNNKEFWNGFTDEDGIYLYFRNCFSFAVDKIGYLHIDENIICAVIVTEPNRRNLYTSTR